MPDGITSFQIGSETYYMTVNEGDSREYEGTPGYVEEERVGNITLDSGFFTVTETTFLQADENLGRLKLTLASGYVSATGTVTEIHAFGARSFSIWNSSGELVYDSGSDFARITAGFTPDRFNSQGDAGSFDNRSDDKGGEPEGLTYGVINGHTYAFIGLERAGGIMVYEVSDPDNPAFVEYIPAQGW